MISYANIIYEYFDPSNSSDFTKLLSLNEQEQDKVMVNLATKLYSHIVNEITDIDFGDIPKSKGDITKIPNYIDMLDCINIIHDLCVRCKQKTTATDTLFKAIDNLKESKNVWNKSFVNNVSLGINTYNSLALAIVCSTSLIISTSIEFIKDQSSEEFNMILNKVQLQKSLESVLFQSLQEFNKGYASGEFTKAIMVANNAKRNISEHELMTFDENAITDALIKAGKDVLNGLVSSSDNPLATGAKLVVTTVSAVALIAVIVIPAIRNAVHFFYSSRQKLSDYYAVQAALVEMNANNIKYDRSKSEEERKRIYSAQMKCAERFRKISNILAVKMNKANVESKGTFEREASEKMSYSDTQSSDKPSVLF